MWWHNTSTDTIKHCELDKMAEKGKKQYNLRSVSNSVQLPEQIHMSSDSEFLSKLSKNQQNSDADESDISDLNCSAL